jgi:diketogulonate reductase-like aldo/keto reductase
MKVGDVIDQSITLNSGNSMPLLGFGTYQVTDDQTGETVIHQALKCGYRLLDCASFYHNEAAVGRAIKTTPRNNLYIVSKVWNDAIYGGKEAVRESCLKSIKDLDCQYLDLYLIHWPVPGKHVAAYHELIRLKREGIVRDIGVSNYTIEDFEELLQSGIDVVPVVNQIEINPFLNRQRTIEYLRARGILPMSFRGLRNGTGLDHPVVCEIATKHGVSAAQILGRWLVQQGICHIPKSSQPERILQNADIWSFELEPTDMVQLGCLTTQESLRVYKEHYVARIVRDTPIAKENKNITVN